MGVFLLNTVYSAVLVVITCITNIWSVSLHLVTWCLLQSAVADDGTPPVDRLWKSWSAFIAWVSCTVTADPTTTSRQKAAQRVHVVYEGNEAECDWWVYVEGICRHQPDTWSQGDHIASILCHLLRLRHTVSYKIYKNIPVFHQL